MNRLRRLSTLRLILLLTGVVALLAVVTGVTMAARGGGPKPPHRSLGAAIDHALHGKPVAGISARVKLTNHLLAGGSAPDTGSPVITGAGGRLWVSKGHLRLELQSGAGDAQLIVTPTEATLYDASSNTVYRLPLPAHSGSDATANETGGLPSMADISRLLTRVGEAASISGARPSTVAGQPAYTVRIGPKHDGGLLGAAELAFDANRGVPLRIAVYSSTDTTPVLELKATDIHYGKIAASTYELTPPPGAKHTEIQLPSAAEVKGLKAKTSTVEGTSAVARAVPFQLGAPRSLVGLPRQTVRAINGSNAGALVVYGRGLGAIVVVERAADASSGSGPLGALPAVSINGASGHELSTPLGTVLSWSRGGVSYTLIGSVPASAAEAAARSLAP